MMPTTPFTPGARGRLDHVLSFILTLALLACGKPKEAGPTPTRPVTEALELPPIVPASAVLVGAFDMGPDWFARAAALSGTSQLAAQAMHGDLVLYLTKTTGLELAKVRRAAVFVLPDGTGALVISDVGGSMKGIPDGDLVAVQSGEYLIVGARSAVDAAIAVQSGKAPGLGENQPLAALFARESAGAVLAVVAEVGVIPDPQLQAAAAQFGAKRVFASLGVHGVRAIVQGDGAKLKELGALIEQQLASMVRTLDQQKASVLEGASLDTGPQPEALGVIVGAYAIKDLAAAVKPRVEGDTLRVELAVGSADAVIVVAVVGTLAAVAVPAFMKYTRKSKTSEAIQGVKRIYDGTRAYHLEHRKLPASAALTPPAGACCQGSAGMCDPSPALWTGAWKDLAFSIEDPGYYSYQLESDGTRFTVRAIGDLDCDGAFSTFEMVGGVLPDGSFQGATNIFRKDDLE